MRAVDSQPEDKPIPPASPAADRTKDGAQTAPAAETVVGSELNQEREETSTANKYRRAFGIAAAVGATILLAVHLLISYQAVEALSNVDKMASVSDAALQVAVLGKVVLGASTLAAALFLANMASTLFMPVEAVIRLTVAKKGQADGGAFDMVVKKVHSIIDLIAKAKNAAP